MKTKTYFPFIMGAIAAIITFIMGLFIAYKNFNLSAEISLGIAILLAVLMFGFTYMRAQSSIKIKKIVEKYDLTAAELAEITGRRERDFPITKGKLQLIVPYRYWAQILTKLEQYEREHPKN
ncbi:hypothetical protein R4Y45_00515 [Holzapfeliella sp. He02]|uniref:ABC transporter ATP-binding protein n=1 Tax=Holzapfeliella saturejae TaxID=3082953 RepID=A0ABU8SFF9_9LACO